MFASSPPCGRFDIARYERFSATNHASVGASAPEHLEEDDRASRGIARVKALGGETIGGVPISEGAGSAGTAVAPRAETPPLKPISWVTISDAAVTTPETKPSDDAATDFVSADERADDAGSAS